MNPTKENKRILALDILRGITIAGMITVNNPGSWSYMYAPLRHAEWNGLTPTDLVFPFFMFIMGISTYISLKKYNFEFSASAAAKIIKRTIFHRIGHRLVLPLLLLLGIGSCRFKFRRESLGGSMDVRPHPYIRRHATVGPVLLRHVFNRTDFETPLHPLPHCHLAGRLFHPADGR